MNENTNEKTTTVREEIEWLLDRIEDERTLKLVETVLNRIVVSGRP